MTSEDRQVSAYREAGTKEAGGKRRSWSPTLKRELVAATLEPGASVSVIARRHDANANQLFKWRRQLLGSPPTRAGLLLPVAVVPAPPPAPAAPPPPALQAAGQAGPPASPGRIEVALPGGVRVRIEGAVDPAAVTAALAAVAKVRRRR